MCGATKEKQPKLSKNRAPGNMFFLGYATLDGTTEATTLRRSMRIRLFILMFGALLLVTAGRASVIFRPGEKVKYVAPGEEEMNGNAQELFSIAQEAENKGNIGRAIKAYTRLWRKHPKDALAPGAVFRAAELIEKTGDYMTAATTYRVIVEKYPSSPHFDEAIEAQFRIGEMYLGGKKLKVLGIPLLTSMDRAVNIFAAVVRTAPYGKYTARAQFDIGLARQKQGANDAAIQAYQAVIDKFPNEPIAADAQYQIGYIWFEAARLGTNDQAATTNARTGFEDFLYKYPKSEKAATARENLKRLDQKSTGDVFKIAKYYDKQKLYRAAVIYYNEVIREQPGSNASGEAKQRIEEIRKKVGESALQPAVAVNDQKKKSVASREEESRGKPTMRGGDAEVAPLPPPDEDTALPPPASLLPSTTTAPEPSSSPAAGSSPAAEASPTPESSVSPDSAASPAS
jgi:outer membrane protein assembly factor BamD